MILYVSFSYTSLLGGREGEKREEKGREEKIGKKRRKENERKGIRDKILSKGCLDILLATISYCYLPSFLDIYYKLFVYLLFYTKSRYVRSYLLTYIPFDSAFAFFCYIFRMICYSLLTLRYLPPCLPIGTSLPLQVYTSTKQTRKQIFSS